MSHEWLSYIEDLIEYLGYVIEFTRGVSKEDFELNHEKYLAVCRAFEIAGEAAKQVPEEIRLRHPEIDWREITGFRDVLAHKYRILDSDIVWYAAVRDAPVAREHLLRILARSGS